MIPFDHNAGKDPMAAYENEILKGLHSAKHLSKQDRRTADPEFPAAEEFSYPNSWQMDEAARHLNHRIAALRHENGRLRAEPSLWGGRADDSCDQDEGWSSFESADPSDCSSGEEAGDMETDGPNEE
ncbi:hypothetical protein [Sporolactobacillus vineae]|uniref:hypothetical protein n=1 Tax=Sporolactobacillus vineae TaxID=444463 RepID=UPI0002895C5A|nr:hypothetical protein [Sporolactobacillus vineae]